MVPRESLAGAGGAGRGFFIALILEEDGLG